MRPSLNILSPDLIHQILTEAKRILAEVGMEIRSPNLRQRLLDHGLKQQDDRIFFPPDVVEWAVAQAPRSLPFTPAMAAPMPTSAATTSILCPAPVVCAC
jgi:trimethylamine:corrinoid methyltransferase-like protein